MSATVIPFTEMQDPEAWQTQLVRAKLRKLLHRAFKDLNDKSPENARDFLRSLLGQSHNDALERCFKLYFPSLHGTVYKGYDSEVFRFRLTETLVDDIEATPKAKENTCRWAVEQRILTVHRLGELFENVLAEMVVMEPNTAATVEIQQMTIQAIYSLPLVEGDHNRLTDILNPELPLDGFVRTLRRLIGQYNAKKDLWVLLAPPAD